MPPVGNQERTRAYYDAFAATYEARRDGKSRYHDLLDDLEVDLALPYVRGREVLEVGCGTGLILRELAKAARHAVGVDLSPGMLEHARRRELEVYLGSATELPFEAERFDVTLSFKTLAHVPDLSRALSEMARVTRPGGTMIVELYNPASLRHAAKRLAPLGREREVYTRFDDERALRRALPPHCRVERARGLRVLVPAAFALEIPLIGPVLERLERAVADTTVAARIGGFVVWVIRKTC
ncbi:MAG: class I SAM-dependent methyltransferase [Polyangiales bacterium]